MKQRGFRDSQESDFWISFLFLYSKSLTCSRSFPRGVANEGGFILVKFRSQYIKDILSKLAGLISSYDMFNLFIWYI